MQPVSLIIRTCARSAVFAAVLLLGTHLGAQEAQKGNHLTEATSVELGKLQPLLDGSNAPAALAIIAAQVAKVPADSYDMAILLQLRAQVLMQNGKFKEGIEPLEKSLALSDSHTPPYLEPRVSLQFAYYLGQLYYQEAIASTDRQVATAHFDKAEAYMVRWTREAPKVTAEALIFYGSLLFNRATRDGEKVDTGRLEKCLGLVEAALKLNTHPPENLYVLKLACLLQLERNAEVADILELLLERKPENASYWQQLLAIYLNLGQETRAIVTIERAQSHGYLNSPTDNANLVAIYFNLGQYSTAAGLLESGLKSGELVNDPKSWELLSFSYQQLHREYKSIDALTRAIAATPDSGQLEYLVAQGYFSLGKTADAVRHAREAVRKGNLARPHQTYLFLAFVSYETKEFEGALDAAEKAMAFPEGADEGKRLKSAILDAIAEREAKIKKM